MKRTKPKALAVSSRDKTASKRNTTRNGKVVSRRRKRKPGFWASIRQLLLLTFFGRMLVVLIAGGMVLLVDLLAISNRYDAFFILTGIELILVGVTLWIRFLIRIHPASRT